jgi:hypothetical protein
MNRTIAIAATGILSGIAAGLMALAALTAGPAAALLLLVSPLTVAIAALGWGTLAGLIALIAASVVLAATIGPLAAVVVAALLFAPVALGGHLANLGRAADNGKGVEWYPLPALLVRLGAAVGAAAVLSGALIGYSRAEAGTIILKLFAEFQKLRPDIAPPAPEAMESAAAFYAALIPFAVPAMWLIAHAAILGLGVRIVRASGRMARPVEDIAANAGLPRAFALAPLLAIAGMFVLPSPGYEIAAAIAGTGVAALGLVGLAEIHVLTRGRPARGFILFLCYAALVLAGLVLAAFAVLGLVRTLRAAQTPGFSGGKPSQ